MCAALYNLSVVQNTDLIGILDGRQAVGNSYGSAGLHQSLQCILYQSLALGVEC